MSHADAHKPETAPPTPSAPLASGGSGGAPAALVQPPWVKELTTLYEAGAASQFLLHGNVHDLLPSATNGSLELVDVATFVNRVLLARFDVVFAYDLGNGLRVERGGDELARWPAMKQGQPLPRDPRAAVELLSHYFRYVSNLGRMGKPRKQVGLVLREAQLVASAGAYGFDASALALQIRDWAGDALLADHALATVLIAENLADLHPLIVNNPRVSRVRLPLPDASHLKPLLAALAPRFPIALSNFMGRLDQASAVLAGASVASIDALLRVREHSKSPLADADLSGLKKTLVEKDAGGLIEFIEPDRTLDDLHGVEGIKEWFRQDIALWKQGDLKAMPMGYLICGPVGTGKTFMVECIAGEAGVPVVKLSNFRDRWVGSTEANLERIFRLLQALGRCIVFVDEADQALGRREAQSGDSGVSGRVYSMMAQEMSDTRNRGRIVWILATSRPDLVEVDLKRPGRIDVKIPILPTTTPEDGFALIRALCRKRSIDIDKSLFDELKPMIPDLLTPGAAEALAVRVYRLVKTAPMDPVAALKDCLSDYQPPVPPDVMEFQIAIAVREATEVEFVPERLRKYGREANPV